MGYIEKVNVLAAKLRTSKLTLQSYATLRDLKENKLKKKAKEAGTKVDKNSANAQWTGDTVDVRKMVEAIFAVLRQAKNQVLMHSDIKRKLVVFHAITCNIKLLTDFNIGNGQIEISLPSVR